MRVLLITGMVSTKYGSLEKWILLYGRILRERNHKLLVHYDKKPISAQYIQLLTKEGIELLYGMASGSSLEKIWYFMKVIRKVKPHLVHSFFTSKSIYAAFFCGIPHKRNFWSNHLAMPKFKWYHHITNRFLNSICMVFPVSESVRNQMLKAGYTSENVRTWYLGLPLEFMNQYNDTHGFDPNLIVSIGHFRSVKGIDLLLQAFALVKKAMPETRLIQVGVDSLSNSEVLDQCKALGVLDSVHWKGIIDNGELEIQQCAVYVQPSRSEALPFTVMEAAFMNKPIVAFKVGGIPEIVDHGVSGYLAEPENVIQLSDFIIKVLKMPETTSEFGKKGHEKICDNFISKVHIEKMVSIYFN